ncbi:MAG: PEP/pyruvate-binding domain-containing protein [Deltaproteobacteria bacterium]
MLEPLPLGAALDVRSCGHKAATLAVLLEAGHNVPDGFVIPVGGSCSARSLRQALERLGPGPYAVRSSGVAEDLAEASFAGQYETVLGVETLDGLVAAVERVRASGTTALATAYRAHAGSAEAPLGVLVQRMVAAQAAGVMFSKNPVTGADEVVIEAVRGLGDRLMAGEVEGDRWVCRGNDVEARVDAGALDAGIARRLAELVRVIAAERGAAQDIEWAMAGVSSTSCRRAPSPG